MKVKEFIKKYHLIAYLIMIILIFTVGMAAKWYRYNEFAGHGPAIARMIFIMGNLLLFCFVVFSIAYFPAKRVAGL